MSAGNNKVTRSDRVAAVQLPPTRAERLLGNLRHAGFWLRILMCAVAATAMWLITQGWSPPLAYRTGYVPTRDLVACASFSVEDVERTAEERLRAAKDIVCIYDHDPLPLTELQRALKDKVIHVLTAESFGDVDPTIWREFFSKREEATSDLEAKFHNFREAMEEDPQLTRFDSALHAALAPFEQNGLIGNLQHSHEEGSHLSIWVYPQGDEQRKRNLNVKKVRITDAVADLKLRLDEEFARTDMTVEQAALVAEFTFNWLNNTGFPDTLSLNETATRGARKRASDGISPRMQSYEPGRSIIASAARPLSPQEIRLLKAERRALSASMSFSQRLHQTAADLGMYVAMFILCGVYVFFHQRRLIIDLQRLAAMLGLVVVTVGLSWMLALDQSRAEIVPLVLFGMIVTIAYNRELALLLAAAVSLIVVMSLRQGLGEFVILVAASAATILLLDRIRSRTRLLQVSLVAGIVAALTTIGVGTMIGQAFGASDRVVWFQVESPDAAAPFAVRLIAGSLWHGFCTLLAGFLMTGLLPYVEKLFNVQTDLSLLELGDVAHPLLQQLAQRAPGTYNHTINVASIAEKAADAIGANGLLVRVGAYFHDIGKMLKPNYFIENQGENGNRHETLVPAMSTLVIIAHVKDGADLARQHNLPQAIIDFIEQHHGTTLVEYFYRQAEKQVAADPDQDEVDESTFRYPGPKPQTREAAVMMLADAVESASRSLVDPAPARIESLVHDLTMKRLMDGQFDECGITLQDLHTIEESLAKSLTSVYHARIKYPNQSQTA